MIIETQVPLQAHNTFGIAAKAERLLRLRSMEDVAKDSVRSIPARRLGTTEEFGATCAFLCSAHAGFITGQNILLDGGAYPGLM
jgi:3-oxoacyl-[acyl-carrier protein] reductase